VKDVNEDSKFITWILLTIVLIFIPELHNLFMCGSVSVVLMFLYKTFLTKL